MTPGRAGDAGDAVPSIPAEIADEAAPTAPMPDDGAGDTLPLRLTMPESVETPAVPDGALPDKEYFKIGEVARIVGVKPYVLRFWETEFKRDIRPDRTRTNQRMYRRRDVETFLEIKRLRYEEKLEVPGAKRKLRGNPADGKAPRTARAKAGSPSEMLERAEASVDLDPSARPLPPASAPAPALLAIERGLKELLRMVDEDENRG